MPRPPDLAPATRAMRGSVYAPGARSLEAAGNVCPLNVGDTWLAPFEGARMEDLREAEHPGMHRYGPTRGVPELLDAIVEKVRARNGLLCEREDILVTAGATGGIAAVVGAIASPGDEVLILAPFWPLVRGISEAFRAVPVEVPFFDRVADAEGAATAVRERLTDRTVALYVSTPSNPTGRILPRAWLSALAELAAREGLWLISDEVYEDYVYRGEHFSVGRLAPERTFSVFSFSKAYGMAGNRVGYVVGPAKAIGEASKIGTHTFYHAPTAGQLAALRALRDGGAWIERARSLYREVGDATAKALGLPPPDGSTFHFFDVAAHLDGRGLAGFLEDCVDRGVALAPGSSCGADYETWVRLCYTAAPPEEVLAAVSRVVERLRPQPGSPGDPA